MSNIFVLLSVVLSFAVAHPATLKDECGVSSYSDAGKLTSYIIGGSKARPGEFPWIVSLRWANSDFDDPWAATCNGVLIKEDWVLTGAQCIMGTPVHHMVAILGQVTAHDTDDTNPWRQQIEIEDWFWHDQLGKQNYYENDIGLIKLKHPAVLNERVRLACLPTDDSSDFAGITGVVAAWGEQHAEESDYAVDLMYIRPPILSNEDCERIYTDNSVTHKMMCAGHLREFQEAPCGGDNSAGLSVFENGRWITVGMVGWTWGCAEGYPNVYTRISPFLTWIEDMISYYPNLPNYP